jgi:hypothetical protein
MGRVARKAPDAVAKEIDESPAPTITQTRARRTPKPNPKYTNESVVLTPKVESFDTPGSSDTEEKPADAKVVKSVKRAAESQAKATKTPAKAKAAFVKKQKLDYDEDEDEEEEKEDDKPAAGARATRSKVDPKDTMKIGDDSVAIIDVSSIISKGPTKPDSPKNMRGPGRKRAVPEESPKEDQSKKKKEEDKPSLITARKSYMPSPAAGKRAEALKLKEAEESDEEKPEEAPANAIKTRRNAGAAASGESPQVLLVEKKVAKVEAKSDKPKKLPMLRKSEVITKMSPAAPNAMPSKTINNNISNNAKPIPRILNSMVTPKGKQSPNVKLAGDGTDKKVFSIDLTDDSIKEMRTVATTPGKTLPVKTTPVAVKENVANNKPQPSTVLKTRLESELSRMKASANLIRRQMLPARQSLPQQTQIHGVGGARRITKFESWYVIDVKNVEPSPFRHTHTFSLIKLGNTIKDLQLPSSDWDYKVTLQKRMQRNENNNDEEEEVYEGEVSDKNIEADKHNYEPSSILFKRSHRDINKISIDRSLLLKQNMYTITMNGKQCKLIGAPSDITSLEDLEMLLSIIDSSNLNHSCIELVTNHDIITIS